MSSQSTYKFAPDYAAHPGEYLAEVLETRSIKRKDFAERCGISEKTVSLIIHGKAPVEPETAIQFERVLRISSSIWNNMQANFRLHQASKADRDRLRNKTEWARRFPLRELRKRGFIGTINGNAAEELLTFFGVGSVEAWNETYQRIVVNYRHSPSFRSAPESVAAWLRIGELMAESIETMPYSMDEFVKALTRIRSITTDTAKVSGPIMRENCRRAGVALVFVSELPKTHLSGATRWLNKDKALIMLSLRYKTDDHFWFSFFHEAAHVLRHGKKRLFLDEKGMLMTDDEKDADNWASDFLIPSREYRLFARQTPFSAKAVRQFAQDIQIAPGIVVGRLQHDQLIPRSWINGLKRKFKLAESRI